MKCGNYAQAETYLQEGLALAQKMGHRENTSLLLANLGTLERDRGNPAQAQMYLQEALTLALTMNHQPMIKTLQANLKMLASAQKDP